MKTYVIECNDIRSSVVGINEKDSSFKAIVKFLKWLDANDHEIYEHTLWEGTILSGTWTNQNWAGTYELINFIV